MRVAAAGVNPVDWAGLGLVVDPPYTPGWELAGTVATASPAHGFTIGDAVFGMPWSPLEGAPRAGAYAESVAVRLIACSPGPRVSRGRRRPRSRSRA